MRLNVSVLKVFRFKAVLMAELLAQPIRQVSAPHAIFPLRFGLQCIASNFCMWTRIEMIYISKSIAWTRRRQFLQSAPSSEVILKTWLAKKPLGTLNYATQSIVSVRKIMLNEYNRNIKVVPLGDVNIFMRKTSSLETIFIAICILPKSGVNTCPPVFRQSLHAEK